MYKLFKSLAFQLDAEKAHHLTVKCLGLFPSVFSNYGAINYDSNFHVQTSVGAFPFPLGIAAGLDKNAELIDYFGRLGVGGLEVGTVTLRPQPGNDKPRLFRLPQDKSLRNSMGFNGDGAKKVLENINIANTYPMRLGINFGKNKITPNDRAIEDYIALFREFKQMGDYYVINVSSPNTPGLRELQDKQFLSEISEEIKKIGIVKPVLLKIAPDLGVCQVKEICELVGSSSFSGIIATNTSSIPEYGQGGISGKLIKEKSTKVRQMVLEILGDQTNKTVIGVGGVDSINDLWKFWSGGGRYMQIYTSFVYRGPKMFSELAIQLGFLFKYFGVRSVDELIRMVHLDKVKLPNNYK